LYEIAFVNVEYKFCTLTTTHRENDTPAPVFTATDVSDVHVTPVTAVPPNRPNTDMSRVPKFVPYTVIDVPLDGKFVPGVTVHGRGKSYVNTCVTVRTSNTPDDTPKYLNTPVPAPSFTTTQESDTHTVASPAVPCTLAFCV
jgi:hypothetical protein